MYFGRGGRGRSSSSSSSSRLHLPKPGYRSLLQRPTPATSESGLNDPQYLKSPPKRKKASKLIVTRMDITVNRLADTSRPVEGLAGLSGLKRTNSDITLNDRTSFDSGINCQGLGESQEVCYNFPRDVGGVPQNLDVNPSQNEEHGGSPGGSEYANVNANNQLSCHNRELDWVVYIESFAERFYMEQNGLMDRIPQPEFDPNELVNRKKYSTLASGRSGFSVNPVSSHPNQTGSANLKPAGVSDSPLYFGNSSVTLIPHKSPANAKDQKKMTSWAVRKGVTSPSSSSSGVSCGARRLPFEEFLAGDWPESEVKSRKGQLSLPGLTQARPQPVRRLIKCASFSSLNSSPATSCLSESADFNFVSPLESVQYTEIECMVRSIIKTCGEIRNVYSKHLKYTNAPHKISQGKQRLQIVGQELSRTVVSDLCPLLYTLLSTGIKAKYSVWEAVRLAAVPVPGVTCIQELATTVCGMQAVLEGTEEMFNAFIIGLLNKKIMETWLLLMLKNTSLVVGCYTSRAYIPPLLRTKALFTQLLLAVQPLAFICFSSDLHFEVANFKHHFFKAPGSPSELSICSEDLDPAVGLRLQAQWRGGSSGECSTSKQTYRTVVLDDDPLDLPTAGGSYRCWDIVEASLGALIKRVAKEGRTMVNKSQPSSKPNKSSEDNEPVFL